MHSRVQKTAAYFRLFKQRMTERNVPQMLAGLMASSAVIMGALMVLVPQTYSKSADYTAAVEFASAQAWGAAYIVAGVTLAATTIVDRFYAQVPVLVLSALHTVLAGFTLFPSINGDGGVPSTIALYLTLAMVCFITQIACGTRNPNEQQ